MRILFLALITSLMLGSCTGINSKKDEKFTPSSIVVFGDGLSDAGRWGKLTSGAYPPSPPFYEGRWTNGPVWIEIVAQKYNLTPEPENNFALGGATSGYYNINENIRNLLGLDSTIKLNGLLGQVEEYLNKHQSADSEAMYVLWAGGHDLGSYLDYGQPDIKQYPVAGNIEMAIELLKSAGAKYFFIGNMPDMGASPAYSGTDKQMLASQLSKELNQGLAMLASKLTNDSIQMLLFDADKLFKEAVTNPDKFGFKYVDESFLPFDFIDFGNPLSKSAELKDERNPDEFMNWWAVSASAAMHRIIADSAFAMMQKEFKVKPDKNQ